MAFFSRVYFCFLSREVMNFKWVTCDSFYRLLLQFAIKILKCSSLTLWKFAAVKSANSWWETIKQGKWTQSEVSVNSTKKSESWQEAAYKSGHNFVERYLCFHKFSSFNYTNIMKAFNHNTESLSKTKTLVLKAWIISKEKHKKCRILLGFM